ncbi:hypothetical protein [Nostoc linckia]|uniref:hypothetical protein n=1 Tax=Nostoc linckia TaxID=92942 RepID=UPI00117CD059|nr:hypothetical protein [Nostoc linckia]
MKHSLGHKLTGKPRQQQTFFTYCLLPAIFHKLFRIVIYIRVEKRSQFLLSLMISITVANNAIANIFFMAIFSGRTTISLEAMDF